MAAKNGKQLILRHPLVVGTAGTVLLLGWHMHMLLSDIPREWVAASAPETLSPAPGEQPEAALRLPTTKPRPLAAVPPVETNREIPPAVTPAPALRLSAPPPAPAAGAPVRGPQWRHAPLPAFSPELVQAMMDPRAARRARRLRRLGITLPVDSASAQPPAGRPTTATDAVLQKAKRVAAAPTDAAPLAPAGSHLPPATGSASPQRAPGTEIARLDRAEPPGAGPANSAPAASAIEGPKADSAKTAVSDGGAGEGKPAGEGGKADGDKQVGAAPPPAAGPPVRLQARVDPPRPAYRVGEWVALRFLASRPVHLRVYRVDAAGRVTRVFSTYSRAEAGSPARTFSTMVKAGEPKPGQEGMIAIGSTRPLTHDELLSCLRAAMSEPSAGSAPPADAASPADPLKAVIDAVGRAADTPETAPAPLDRSGWSVAIGRFTSAPRKLSDDQGPPARGRQSAAEGAPTASALRRGTL